MKNKIINLAQQKGLLSGFTTTEIYKKHKPLDESFSYAKSIISFAMPINKGASIMASYAMEQDYHITLTDLLSDIAVEAGLVKYDICVDTAPIDDKLSAYLAGVGYYGKNSLIITEVGSYVMLGEIVTEHLFEPDAISTDDCGKCTLCIKACPTDAMDDIYGKCLAGFLQRKIVQTDSVYKLFETIYGCDICLEVCPENRAVLETSFSFEDIDIFDILKCSKKEFRKYSNYAFYWLGHNVVKRNIVVYAKNKNINIDSHLSYINSKEEYMIKALEYYGR